MVLNQGLNLVVFWISRMDGSSIWWADIRGHVCGWTRKLYATNQRSWFKFMMFIRFIRGHCPVLYGLHGYMWIQTDSSIQFSMAETSSWKLRASPFFVKQNQLLQSGIPNGWCPFLPRLQVHLNPFLDHSLRAPGWSTLQSGTSGIAVEFGFAEKWVDKMSGNFWGAS